MQIGQLAKQTDTTPETIRYYEREGLIPLPLRGANGYREYSPAHVQKLRFIRRCRVLELSLADIKQLLAIQNQPDAPCQEVDRLIARQRAQIREKLAALQQLDRDLKCLAELCNRPGTSSDCGILGALTPQASAST